MQGSKSSVAPSTGRLKKLHGFHNKCKRCKHVFPPASCFWCFRPENAKERKLTKTLFITSSSFEYVVIVEEISRDSFRLLVSGGTIGVIIESFTEVIIIISMP